MGSDSAPQALFEAVLRAQIQFDTSYHFLVFANDEVITSLQSYQQGNIEFHLSPEVITMRDEPVQSVRKKKGSSLVQGIRALKKKNIDAFVSAGNTGALIASSTLSLPRFQNIRRPALIATIPTENGHVVVLDIGGNVMCKAAHLVRFADLGAAFERIYHNITTPRVGLLNVGAESKKGTHELRQAYQLLQEHSQNFQFMGNIEGREVFQGKVNVLVTDGFSGNVLLKTTEGVAFFILEFLKKNFSAGLADVIKQLDQRFSYDEYPGALLLGVEGVVVKCHGDASAKALFNGIKAASSYVQQQLIPKMKEACKANG